MIIKARKSSLSIMLVILLLSACQSGSVIPRRVFN